MKRLGTLRETITFATLLSAALLWPAGMALSADAAAAKPGDEAAAPEDEGDNAMEPGSLDEGEEEEEQAPVDQVSDTGVSVWASTEEALPAATEKLNRAITINYKNKIKGTGKKAILLKGKSINGTLVAIYEEMLPFYAAETKQWMESKDLLAVVDTDERSIPWRDVKSITFDRKYEKEYRQEEDLELVSCVPDTEISANYRVCSMLQQYQVQAKGIKGGKLQGKKRYLLLVSTGKGKVTHVELYLGKITVDNRKNEVGFPEQALSDLLIKEYRESCPESIIIR